LYFGKTSLVAWFSFLVLYCKKPFSVGLVDQVFQPVSNQVETVENAWEATAVVFAGFLTWAQACYENNFVLS
jgi:hypothetical protein